MVRLRILLEVHVGHAEQHPPAARRDLRIAHPLYRHQVRKGHWALAGSSRSTGCGCPTQALLGWVCLRTCNRTASHPNHHCRQTNRSHPLHRVSLNPRRRSRHSGPKEWVPRVPCLRAPGKSAENSGPATGSAAPLAKPFPLACGLNKSCQAISFPRLQVFANQSPRRMARPAEFSWTR
jgi:hypothetical protein